MRPSGPTPRRPGPDRLRLARRIALGMSRQHAVQAEAAPGAEVDRLLAEPGFDRLVDACREVEALPEERRLQRLRSYAYIAIQDACLRGDVRVALFVLRELDRGRNPARTVAEGLVRACKRAATAAPPGDPHAALPAVHDASPTPAVPRVATRRPRAPDHPAAANAWRTAARLRREVGAEELVHAAGGDASALSPSPRGSTAGPTAATRGCPGVGERAATAPARTSLGAGVEAWVPWSNRGTAEEVRAARPTHRPPDPRRGASMTPHFAPQARGAAPPTARAA